MNLGKLTIHNIASIEDAVIDFAGDPLRDADLFLISGITGSGKSVILDAVCLALYGTTPRLNDTHIQGLTNDAGQTITTRDPRQMLRRNTGEGFVSLTFVGNNGKRYEAIWSVQRARRKPAGRLQSRQRTLTISTPDGHGLCMTKESEINAELKDAVGLDFAQFCRTSMLSQGEFTRFLDSTDEEKASILEKITGVDIYAAIGRKIYECTGERERTWSKARAAIEGVTVLTDEAVAVAEDRHASLAIERDKAKTCLKDIENKLKWLADSDVIDKSIAATQASFMDAQEALNTDKAVSARQTVAIWEATVEIRNTRRNLKSVRAAISLHRNAIEREKRTYAALLGALMTLDVATDALVSKQKDVSDALAGYDTRLAAIGEATRICGLLDRIADEKRKSREAAGRVRDLSWKLDEELRPTEKKLADELGVKSKQVRIAADEIASREESLERINLPALRRAKESAVANAAALAAASRAFENLVNERARIDRDNARIRETKAYLENLHNRLPAAKEAVRVAAARLEAATGIFQRQRMTAEEWTRHLRTHLVAGESCPVCGGSVVEANIPRDEQVNALLAEAEAVRSAAELEYKDAEASLNTLESDIRARQTMCDDLCRSVSESDATDRYEKSARESCDAVGIDSLDDNTFACIEEKKKENEEAISSLTRQITDGETLEAAVKERRKTLAVLEEAVRGVQSLIDKNNSRIADIRASVQAESRESEICAANADVASRELGTLLNGYRWMNDPLRDPEEFRNELNRAVADYTALKDTLSSLPDKIGQNRAMAGNIRDILGAVTALMPEWADVGAVRSAVPDDAVAVAGKMLSGVRSAFDQLAAAEETEKAAMDRIDKYLEDNPDISEAMLDAADALDNERIGAMRGEIRSLNEAVTRTKTLYENALASRHDHDCKRPDFNEDDTSRSLAESAGAVTRQAEDIAAQITSIRMALDQDRENRARLGELLTCAEEAEAEFRRWEHLNDMFGDATGSKFRKIAQSFVLENLIHSANRYMATLSGRYTLTVEPGTFIIAIEDAYQGYARRAASTLSGGESFLVSLALALALSDIDQRLAMDTLFIDEGFGTLSGEPLNDAVNTLRSLQTHSGRRVGIISHIEELRERIPVRICVERDPHASASRVSVTR